jgi:hypothetical protein
MNVSFETVKRAWQERMFEGHLRERPLIHDGQNIRKRIESLNRRIWLRDLEMAVSYVVLVSALFLIFAFVPSVNIRVGILLIFSAILPMLIAFVRVHIQSRNPHCELPRKLFLMHQEEKIEARIRFMRRGSSWYLLPVYAGYVLFMVSTGSRLLQILVSVASLASVNFFVYYCLVKPRIRNFLQPCLDSIRQRLSEYEEIESEVE